MRIASWRVLATDATESLLRRPWHALAMMSGIMLGVAGATAAMIVADTQQATVDLRFDLQRSSHAVVRSMQPNATGFPLHQVQQIAQLEPVRDVGEFSTWSERETVALVGTEVTASVPVIVADPGGLAASRTRAVSGAAFHRIDDGTKLRVWVGRRLGKELGVGVSPTDTRITIGRHQFVVAGILANSGGFEYVDRSVVMTRGDALAAIDGYGNNVRLLARVRPGSASVVAQFAERAADPTGEMMLHDVTPPDGERLVKNVGDDLRRIGIALGTFVGIAGMITIANTLMMSILSRRRELGLRSAMGWSRSRIGSLVLAESAVAGVIAGIIGAAIGSGGAAAAAWLQGWTLVVAPWLPPLVVAGGAVASLLGGAIPAIRAASISPLEAMRS